MFGLGKLFRKPPRTLEERVEGIEAALRDRASPSRAWTSAGAALLSAWPVFALVVFVTLYTPIRAILAAVPKKIEAADEIGIGSVSLKTTIRTVARAEGLSPVGEHILKLSESAIVSLLRHDLDSGDGLVGYNDDSDAAPRLLMEVHFPSETTLSVLAELEAAGLVRFEGGDWGKQGSLTVAEIREYMSSYERRHPGRRLDGNEENYTWILKPPIPESAPGLFSHLTTSGRAAQKLIIQAVIQTLHATSSEPGVGANSVTP